MTHVGVDAEAQGWLWRLLGALLLLGQLDFGEAEGLAEAQLAEPEVLQTFCDLLQLDCEPMQRALQIKMTKAGSSGCAAASLTRTAGRRPSTGGRTSARCARRAWRGTARPRARGTTATRPRPARAPTARRGAAGASRGDARQSGLGTRRVFWQGRIPDARIPQSR